MAPRWHEIHLRKQRQGTGIFSCTSVWNNLTISLGTRIKANETKMHFSLKSYMSTHTYKETCNYKQVRVEEIY